MSEPKNLPSCPACGVEYTLHAGMTGTCRSLQNTLIRFRLALKTLRQIAECPRNTRERRLAVATIRMLENIVPERTMSTEGALRLLAKLKRRLPKSLKKK